MADTVVEAVAVVDAAIHVAVVQGRYLPERPPFGGGNRGDVRQRGFAPCVGIDHIAPQVNACGSCPLGRGGRLQSRLPLGLEL